MNRPHHVAMIAIDAGGCAPIPFMESASQTFYDYANGVSGYIVLVVGVAVLVVSMLSRKQLAKAPGWLTGVIALALALGSLPVFMVAFGIDLGCKQATTSGTESVTPSTELVPRDPGEEQP